MTSITITAHENMVAALQSIAKQQATTFETVLQDALQSYVRAHAKPPAPKRSRRYQCIGIGRSGHGELSVRAEEILAEAANRREGWSLP